ncbi:hypothetical protein CAPTEDRAFT_224110 [Capitella teleta]|uniref:Uncharacterized protein n=1 Tax=Capitella teleta TaxID=283909 RepID=R7UPM6_CAPTE|nr:hypothetical protein CAPTEDRAFT_224110 [Capitella teleta]|eukprot:ELU05902.1 hypothetical protein CAPTEDRAFT_224110 [Capitella teleta]
MSGTKGNLLLCLFLTYAVAAGNSESQFERWTGDLYEAFKAISSKCSYDECEQFVDRCGHIYAADLINGLNYECPPCRFASNLLTCWNSAGLSATCCNSVREYRHELTNTLIADAIKISTTECRVVKDAESILDICPHLPAITVTDWRPVVSEDCSAPCATNGTSEQACFVVGTEEKLDDTRCYGPKPTTQLITRCRPDCPAMSTTTGNTETTVTSNFSSPSAQAVAMTTQAVAMTTPQPNCAIKTPEGKILDFQLKDSVTHTYQKSSYSIIQL